MARRRRDARIETRAARAKLTARDAPYWRQLEPGLALGYRRHKTGGVWLARRFHADTRKYDYARLGAADDHEDADGALVLDYGQATRAALGQKDTSAAIEVAGGRIGYTVADAMRDYVDWFRAHRKGLYQVEGSWNRHISKLDERPVADLTTAEIRRWHQAIGRKLTHATANRVFVVLRAALNRAYQDGHAPSDAAWRRVKPFRDADVPKVRYLDQDACTRLLNACEPDFRDLVHAALLTGCRFGELVALEVTDYHPDAGTVSIWESKGGKARHVPLTDEGVDLLDRVSAGRKSGHAFLRADAEPWAKHQQVRRIKDASDRAGISPSANFHILRHTFASLLAMRGVPMQVIASALGHSDTRMTERHYAHLAPSHVHDTIRAHMPTFTAAVSSPKVSRMRGRS